MSDPIGPGDIVECIDNRDRNVKGTYSILTIGSLYKVKEVGIIQEERNLFFIGKAWISLHGVKSNAKYGFFADRFRLIKKRKDGEFNYLLKNIPLNV